MQPQLTRRQFLKQSTAAAMAGALSSATLHARETSTAKSFADRLILSAPLTHSDWMLKENPKITFDPGGVRHMLGVCKAAGLTQIYWRVLDAGRAMYKSRLVLPAEHFEFDQFYNPVTAEEKALLNSFHMPAAPSGGYRAICEKFSNMDYSQFDSFASAIEIGHELGLKIHAWVTINEDDHGWGGAAAFSRLWPEYRWVRRDGRSYRSQLSFAFPKVMEYKLGIIKELLAYDLDGLFIDWLRTGDVRDNPQTDATGTADYGYEEPLVKGFKQKFGIDPLSIPNNDQHWVRYRSEPRTQFMRHLRKLARRHRPALPVNVLVAHPWCYRGLGDKIDGNLNGLLLDVGAWAREGLIDAASAAGYFQGGGSTGQAFHHLQQETGSLIEIWPYEWIPKSPAEFAAQAARARTLGAKQILFWEADYLDDLPAPARENLAAAMSAQAAPSPRARKN